MREIRRAVLAAALSLSVLSTGVVAQETATLKGRVTDAAGSAIPGANVTATNEATKMATTRPAKESGEYEFAALPPGRYTLRAEAQGYQSGVRRGVEVKAGQEIVLNFTLNASSPGVAETVAVGTRARPRPVAESTVPVHLFPAARLARQGASDLAIQLRTLIPSYNVNLQLTDAAKISRPANIRNLAPDHTLVLVNEKRRHRSAIIVWGGNGVADGTQGPDVSPIPRIALRQVEVLHDGAAAQYGSDAIGGVLNLVLKDGRSGGGVEFRTGHHQDGGGGGYTFSAQRGLPFGEGGFANLSLEYGHSDPTDRSAERTDAAALVAAGNDQVRMPAQVWGSPRIEDDLKLFGNFGYSLADRATLYGHANYATKRVSFGFFFRNPNTRNGVFSNDGGETLLVGDLLAARGQGSADCPTVTITNHVPDPVALARVFADPNCFSFQELFPGGFTPDFGGEMTDASVVTGLRGTLSRGVRWDASVSVGSNEADFFIDNTVNASFGPETPTSFDPGLYRQREINVNFDVAYPMSERLDLAAGAEWRSERFEIGLGERESWHFGPLAAQGFSAGSNGFPGFSPIAAGNWSRGNVAAYADAEMRDRAGKWDAGAALRIENFADFGTAASGKLSGRFRLHPSAALRASVGNGFRAPTPAQQNAFNVSTRFDPVVNDLVNRGTIPSISELARRYGGEPLKPERSVNFSFGMVVEAGSFSLEADYFRIDLSDRFGNSRDINLSPEEVEVLVSEGITSASNLRSFRFFINDFSTSSQGIDLVSAYAPPALGGGTIFGAAFNYTHTAVTKHNPQTLSERRIRQLGEALPETRWNVSVTQRAGRVSVLGRLSYYGAWFDWDDPALYEGNPLVDLEIGLPIFSPSTRWVLGAHNALNTYPEENRAASRSGERYSRYTPWGFNGAYYYAALSYEW